MHYTIEQYPTIEASHKTGIGGSGAAACIGWKLGQKLGFKSHHALYAELVGIAPEFTPSRAMQAGTELEGLIRKWYEADTGYQSPPNWNRYCLRSTKYPWMIANLDWISHDGKRLAEFKCAFHESDEWGTPGTDAIPIQYWYQVAHYQIVTGIEEADLAVFVGGDIRIYHLKYNAHRANQLIECERAFWEQHVKPKVPPPADYTDDSADVLKWTYPRETRELEECADASVLTLLHEYERKHRECETEKMSLDDLKHKIMAAIGEREGYRWGKNKITWKARTDGVRVFRPYIAKETA